MGKKQPPPKGKKSKPAKGGKHRAKPSRPNALAVAAPIPAGPSAVQRAMMPQGRQPGSPMAPERC
jgi:hypothetical protein